MFELRKPLLFVSEKTRGTVPFQVTTVNTFLPNSVDIPVRRPNLNQHTSIPATFLQPIILLPTPSHPQPIIRPRTINSRAIPLSPSQYPKSLPLRSLVWEYVTNCTNNIERDQLAAGGFMNSFEAGTQLT